MNKLNAKMRATEVDALSDALVRLYKADAGAQGESASSLKKLLVGVINDKLVPYLSAMALANASVYSRFAAKAEEEISRANETVARRGK